MATARKKKAATADKAGAKRGTAKKKAPAKKAARRAALTVNRILFPVDLRDESSWRHALPVAVEEARNHQAELHIVMVLPDVDVYLPAVRLPKDYNRRRLQEGAKDLEAFARERVPEDVPYTCTVKSGTVYREILKAAQEADADLVVMASHRPSLRDFLLGPNAARVVRHARCSVLIVRES